MKKYFSIIMMFALALLIMPRSAFAAGISASGGGTKTVGQTFTVTVTASGTDFNTVQGKISVSGPVSIVSFNAGSADVWMTKPSNGASFAGAFLGRTVNSCTIATIQLKGTSAGNGVVALSNVALINAGKTVGSSAGGADFTIQRAPDLPGTVSVSSATHPDQAQAYEATTVTLSWAKASNVTGFSYLLDQAASTTPPSKVTDTNTSATYQNQAVGTYYFHIKAQSADGWGPVTHFKVIIKEPDPKIKADLEKPSDIKIVTIDTFENDIVKGTFSGFKITGVTVPNYTTNITLLPAPALPEGKLLSAKADASGVFELLIDFPIPSGHYTMTIQGQDDKILTPVSDPVYFEISQSKGGTINILTESDNLKPIIPVETKVTPKWYQKINFKIASATLGGLLLISIAGIIVITLRNKRDRGLIRHLKSMK